MQNENVHFLICYTFWSFAFPVHFWNIWSICMHGLQFTRCCIYKKKLKSNILQGFYNFIIWCLRVWERTWNRLRLIWSDLNIQYTSWIRPYTCLFILSLVISWLLSLHKQYDLKTCYMSVRHVLMFCEGYLKVKQSICGDDQVHVWNKPPKYIVQKNQFTCLPQICITGTKYL